MSKSLFGSVFILICAVSTIFSQTGGGKSINQFPSVKAEPFKLETGSSFSASTSRPNQTVNVSDTPLSESAKEIPRLMAAQDYNEALEVIRSNYVNGKKLDYDQLTESALTAMLRTLDPHSNYFNPKEYQDLLTDEQSAYIGVGASITNFTKNGKTDTYVTSAFPDSPAFRSGLRFGDKIIAVNGESMSGKNSYDVREKIRGPKGTVARLTIERAANGKIEILEVKRNIVPQPSIPDAYMLRPGVGYIDFSNGFNYTTMDELNVALGELHKQGMTSLIFDLRDNPGGIVEQAVKVAEKFLPAGQTILTQRGRTEIDNRTWKSAGRNMETMPLVLLVNNGSASASEIVTGALQDYDRALIVGEKTFGKGLVQSVINLPYGAGLTLTTAKYYTPSGRSIQRDYEHGNLYDYYQRKVSYDPSANATNASKTVTGRNVYGGDGILPDEVVKTPTLTAAQVSLIDPIFFFSREVVNGRISGLENYKITRPVQYGQRISPSDIPSGAELFARAKEYLLKNNPQFSAEQIEANQKFILLHLRYELAVAAFGNVAANQVLIENDVQVAKAIDSLPRAQNLALAARKIILKK